MAEQLSGLADDRALLGRTSTAERVSDILAAASPRATSRRGHGCRRTASAGRSASPATPCARRSGCSRMSGCSSTSSTAACSSGCSPSRTSRTSTAPAQLVECAVVRGLGEPPYALDALADGGRGGASGRSAKATGKALGTANIHFHRELVALAGSDRTDELMRSVFAELRLAFHVVDDPTAAARALPRPQPSRSSRRCRPATGRAPNGCSRSICDDSLERVVDVYRQQGGRPVGARRIRRRRAHRPADGRDAVAPGQPPEAIRAVSAVVSART